MTEEEIQAEIKRRVDEQSAPAATVDSSSAEANPYAALRAAEEEALKAKKETKSSVPGVDTAVATYQGLSKDAQPYALGAAGYMGGKALRKMLPQEQVIGTPEYVAAQQNQEHLIANEEPKAARAAQTAQETVQNAQDQHQARRSILGAQLQDVQQQHAINQAELQQAEAQHAHAQTLHLEDELARRQAANTGMARTAGALPAPIGPAPEINPLPRGGEGTANYAEKFGANEIEAKKVPSMSAMQQENIPTQRSAYEKINALPGGSGYQPIQESPLLLNAEGQQAVRERLAAQEAEARRQAMMEDQRRALADAERQRLQEGIAQHKAQSQIRLENARENARLTAKALAAANRAYDTHVSAPSVTPAQNANVGATADELQELRDRIAKNAPSGLARFGAKFAGRFIPGMGAAFAPLEVENMRNEFRAGNPVRAAAHGVGALGALAQATGIPPLMGAGDIAQLAPLAAMGYDYATGRKDAP